MEQLQHKIAPSMLRAKAVTPKAGCANCLLQYVKRLNTISNVTVLGHEEKDLLSPHSSLHHYYVHNEVLLSTANVLIQEPSGNYTDCRALVDSGSQVSFISRAFAMKLNLDVRVTHLHVEGIAASNLFPIHQLTRLNLRSFHDSAFCYEAQAYLVPEVIRELPTISFTDATHMWPHLHYLRLADPEYNMSRRVDLLLGADCFPFIMRSAIRIGTEGQPMAQETVFGWVLLGPVTLRVQLTHSLEFDDQAEERKADDGIIGQNTGKSSLVPSWIKWFDFRNHSHPGPGWLRKFSLFPSPHARRQQKNPQLDSTKK